MCALVQLTAVAAVSEAAVIAHVKAQLAAYKAPRRVFVIDQLYRAPNGKLDYVCAKHLAQARGAAVGK